MPEALFHCDDALWQRFAALCRPRDETPDAVLRDLVRLEVQCRERRKANSAEGVDELLLRRAFGFSSLRLWRKQTVGGSRRLRCGTGASALRLLAGA